MEMSAEDSIIKATSNGEELQKEYLAKYPQSPRYSPYLVGLTNLLEFKEYFGSQIDHAETIVHLGAILHENLLRHLLKHHEKLNWIANCIYDEHLRKVATATCAEFDNPTYLKNVIVEIIGNYPSFRSNSSDSATVPRKTLLLNFATEIQTILVPALNFKISSHSNDLDDPWSPIHLSVSFPLFCLLVNNEVKLNKNINNNVLKKENRNLDAYKNKYILHMSSAAVNDREFLLAMLSAYGTDVRKYPSGLHCIMGEKKMLREKLQAVHERQPPVVPSFAPAQTTLAHERQPHVVPSFLAPTTLAHVEAALMKPNGYSSQLHERQPHFVHGGSFIDPTVVAFVEAALTKADAWKLSPSPPETPQPVKAPASSQSKTPTVGPTSSAKLPVPSRTGSPSTVNNVVYENKTASMKKFLDGAVECWKLFYGSETTKAIPPTWYSNFNSQFPIPNNKEGILNNSIEQLLRDKEQNKKSGYKIPRLSDIITRAKFEAIEKELNDTIPKYPSVVLTPAAGIELLMWNNKSQLQRALISPLTPEELAGGNKSKSVPRTDSWAPNLCVMPYHGFIAHAEWYLQQASRKGKPKGDLRNFDLEIIKLRYAEYISRLNKNANQLVLGVFTAYGPQILDYPVRVLQILKDRDLLRQTTKLYEAIPAGGPERLYIRITPIANSPTPATTEKEIKPAETLDFGRGLLSCLTSDFATLPKPLPRATSSPKPKLEPRIPEKAEPVQVRRTARAPDAQGNQKRATQMQNPPSFEYWRAACDRSLGEMCDGASIQFEIPETYYKQLYESYQNVVSLLKQGHSDEGVFQLFMLGVWSGQHLNDFAKDLNSSFATPNRTPEKKSFGTQSEELPSSSTNVSGTEKGDAKECAVVHVPTPYSGQLQLSKDAFQILPNIGVIPDPSVESILTTFAASRKAWFEAIEKIQDNFAGDKIHDFVTELSCRICWVSNEEELKLTAMLVRELIEMKLVSKAYVIHCIKNGVIKHLPDLAVKVVNAIAHVAEFLVHLFIAEEDFCWFMTMTDELSKTFIPVWSDLATKTARSLKRRTSETAILDLFSKTPGVRDFDLSSMHNPNN